MAKRLVGFASRLRPRPDALSELDSDPDAKKLWEHAMYFEKHHETMDYPEYRKKGWPIGSGSVESACGQFGDRVKHARMRPHAEAGRRPSRGEGGDPLGRRPLGEDVARADPGAGPGAVHHSRIRELTEM
ncbi:MAG TPA: hypothetical protein VM492_05600 [Sumerlaeia bacterium]|nr:hypothetical protein [Sumerlaeia bacterium]